MKVFGIGLIVLLLGIALVAGQSGLNFYWTHNPPETFREVRDMEDQMKIATSIGLAGNIVALIGVVIFILEFIMHEHKALALARPTRFCSNCGRVVAPDSKFCPQCGNALPD